MHSLMTTTNCTCTQPHHAVCDDHALDHIDIQKACERNNFHLPATSVERSRLLINCFSAATFLMAIAEGSTDDGSHFA